MTVKRKSNRPTGQDQEETTDSEYLALLQQKFEAQFGHIEGFDISTPESKESDTEVRSDVESNTEYHKSKHDSDDENNDEFDLEIDHNNIPSDEGSSESDSDSESDQEDKPVVVKFVDPSYSSSEQYSKQDKKLFMSSKAPKFESDLPSKPVTPKEASEEKLNLENDLALQRLIQESHILAEAGLSGVDISTGITGKVRHKTLDSRLDALGMKKAKAARNPMLVQQGMNAKQSQRKERRVTAAKEAGIVLARSETAKVKKPENQKMRQRGLKINLVGKETRNGLVISKREIEKYSGTSGGGSSGKKGGKRRR